MGEKINSFRGQYLFLSNFYKIPGGIEYEGDRYPTSEHAYQAAKTANPLEKKLIREAVSPGWAKRLGKTVTLRKDWQEEHLAIMFAILVIMPDTEPVQVTVFGINVFPVVVPGFFQECLGVGKGEALLAVPAP